MRQKSSGVTLAVVGGNADIFSMKRFWTGLSLYVALIATAPLHAAYAQDLLSPPPQILPPPPAAPPPPRIEVPRVPQMGEVPQAPKAALQRRKSFDRRVTDCIHQGAGLGPNERSAYSRACAN